MAKAFSVFKCHAFENARCLSQPLKNSASNHPTKLLSAVRTRRLTTENVLFEPARDASQSDVLLGLAGGGARTHTILRSLDFESSASANSATPAWGSGAKRYEIRAQAQHRRLKSALPLANPVWGRTRKFAKDGGRYTKSSIRKPRGGP